MDIEEERKAFQAALPENADWIFMDGKFAHIVIQKRFDAWLAAKAHALEMAKPTTVKIMTSSRESAPYPCIVSLFEGETFNGVLEDFHTTEEASEWAISNGYRVVK